MSEMIERVQEAIRKEIGTRHQGLPKGGWDGLMKQAAIVAIAAMREPTMEMESAASNWQGPQMTYSDVWRAMIDEALGKTK